MPPRLRHTALVAALAALAAAAAARGQERPPDDVKRLIRQLGDPQYARREAAERQLEALGPAAVPALREAGARPGDLELALRARRAYWRILLPEGEDPGAREQRAAWVGALPGASPATRRELLRQILSARSRDPYPLAFELAGGEDWDVLLDWIPRAPGVAECKELLERLWPRIEAQPQRIGKGLLERVLLELPDRAPALAVRAACAGRPHDPHIVRWLLAHQEPWARKALLEVSRKPGAHRFTLGAVLMQNLDSRGQGILREVLPGLHQELERQAREREPHRDLHAVLPLLREYTGDWNPRLMQLVRDPRTSPPMRAALVAALDPREPVPGIEGLLPWLESGDPSARFVILRALQHHPEPTALPRLRQLFVRHRPGESANGRLPALLAAGGTAEDWALLEEAARAPAPSGRAAVYDAIASRPGGRGLAFLRRHSVEERERLSRADREALAWRFLYHERERWPRDLDVLALITRDGDLEARRAAVSLLGEADRTALPLLTGLLDGEEDSRVLEGIALGLAQIDPGIARAALLERLKKIAPGPATGAAPLIQALGLLEHRAAAPAIRACLSSRSPDARGAAVRSLTALQAIGEPELLRLLEDRDPQAAEVWVLDSLEDGCPPGVARAILDRPKLWSDRDRAYLVERSLGSRALVEVARRYLEGKLPPRARESLEELFSRHWRKEQGALRPLLAAHRERPEHRKLVDRFLAVMGDEERLQEVIGGLADPARVGLALEVLADRPDERSLGPLVGLLQGTDARLADLAVQGLECVVWRNARYQRVLYEQDATAVQWWRSWVAAHPGPPRRVDWLHAMVRERRMENEAHDAIRRLGLREMAGYLLAVLDKRPWDELVIGTLGHLRDPRAIPPLRRIAALHEDRTADVALLALGRLGDPRAIALIAHRLDWMLEHGRHLGWGYEIAPMARVAARHGYRVGCEALLQGLFQGNAEAREELLEFAGLRSCRVPWMRYDRDWEPLLDRLRLEAWWRANQERFRALPAPAGTSPASLIARFRTASGPERYEAIMLLSRAPALDPLEAVRVLLGPDNRLSGEMAEVLGWRGETWAGPFLEAALRGGRALPGSAHAERKLLGAIEQETQGGPAAGRWLRVLADLCRDPWCEALLATRGRGAILALVETGSERSLGYRHYLRQRFRDWFGSAIPEREGEPLDRELDRWAAWGRSAQNRPIPAIREGPLAAWLAAARPALRHAEPLVRSRALSALWPAMDPQERAAWMGASDEDGVGETLLELYWRYPATFVGIEWPAALESRRRQGLLERLEQATEAQDLWRADAFWNALCRAPGLDARAWNRLAECARSLGCWPEEAGCRSRAADGEPQAFLLDRAHAWAHREAYGEAIRDLDRLQTWSPDAERRADRLALRGAWNEAAGRLDEAERDLAAAEASSPGPPALRFRLPRASLAWKRGRAGQVLVLLRELPDPSDRDARILRAMALVRQSRTAEARAVLCELGLELRQRDAGEARGRLYLAWALVWAATGDREAALTYLTQAIRRGAIGEAEAARLPELARLGGGR